MLLVTEGLYFLATGIYFWVLQSCFGTKKTTKLNELPNFLPFLMGKAWQYIANKRI